MVIMKIKIPGCSVCKRPYDWKEGIRYDDTKCYIFVPLCKDDEKHTQGYNDDLLEIEV